MVNIYTPEQIEELMQKVYYIEDVQLKKFFRNAEDLNQLEYYLVELSRRRILDFDEKVSVFVGSCTRLPGSAVG